MATKDELVNMIKDWVLMDNEIITYQNKIKELKKNKKGLNDSLINIMRENEIDCFDLNDGKILYSKKVSKSPLNKKSLVSILSKFYEDDVDKATKMSDYLLENREEKTVESIKRKINK